MYEAENKLLNNVKYALDSLNDIHMRIEDYANAEAFGIRYETRRSLELLADLEAHLYALCGEIRKAERLTSITND